MKCRLGLALAALSCIVPMAHAQSGFSGEFDLEGSYAGNSADSLDATLGERDHADQRAWLRLMWNGDPAPGWNLDFAYLADLRHGGGVVLARDEHALMPSAYVDPDRTAPLRLSQTVSDRGQVLATQRLDRLALSYSSSSLVLRVGRQALTWGGGLVFHPMDLFNPFPPDATYTAYKPGADMLYGQWLFDSGADIQAVAVPRRDPDSGKLAAGQSSTGLKWHGFLGTDQQFGLDLMLARDYRSDVLGVGLSGQLAGATWSAEAVPTRLAGGTVATSLLANLQYAWVWGGRNVDGYVEYFRNGFGVSGEHDLADLPAALSERLARGELFTVSKNYLALGLDLQWTPLLTLKPSLIANLDDGSTLLLGQALYSLSQNTSLTVGLQWARGGRGSEYGGLETANGSGVYAVPADLAYARLTWYFK